MNIFALDLNTTKCAEYHCDKHVLKMPTETAQMISFVYYDKKLWNTDKPELLMKFSKNHSLHPCSLWIKDSLLNFMWSCELGIKLVEEYRFRYDSVKHNRCYDIFKFGLNNPPDFDKWSMTDFALAMPNEFKTEKSSILSYRNFYTHDKCHLHNWKKRNVPNWINYDK